MAEAPNSARERTDLRIGWGPSHVGRRVRTIKRHLWERRKRGVIESSYHDSAFGAGVYVRIDDGDLRAYTGTGRLNAEWEFDPDAA